MPPPSLASAMVSGLHRGGLSRHRSFRGFRMRACASPSHSIARARFRQRSSALPSERGGLRCLGFSRWGRDANR
eukprot:5766838-Pyramimonas_sp.AAC.1